VFYSVSTYRSEVVASPAGSFSVWGLQGQVKRQSLFVCIHVDGSRFRVCSWFNNPVGNAKHEWRKIDSPVVFLIEQTKFYTYRLDRSLNFDFPGSSSVDVSSRVVACNEGTQVMTRVCEEGGSCDHLDLPDPSFCSCKYAQRERQVVSACNKEETHTQRQDARDAVQPTTTTRWNTTNQLNARLLFEAMKTPTVTQQKKRWG